MAVHLLRNMKKTRLIIPIDGRPPVVMAGAGDGAGNDIVPLSEADVNSPAVFRAMQKGLVASVEGQDESEVMAEIARRNDIVADRQSQTQAQAIQPIILDRAQDRDMAGVTCTAPSAANPQLPCGALIVRPAVRQGQEPPLCDQHEGLAGQYVATEVDDENEPLGKTRTQWSRVGLGTSPNLA